MIRRRIVKIPCNIDQQLVEEELPSTIVDGSGDIIPTYLQSTHVKEGGSDVIIDTTPLIRLDRSSPGLYAYVISSVCKSEYNTTPNIRSTRLSMACGCHSNRFVGDVWIGRLGYSSHDDGCGLSNIDISISDIHFAVEYSPDLRITIQQEMQQQMKMEVGIVPDWLGYASQKNYHDGGSIKQLAVAMSRADIDGESSDDNDDDSSSSSSSVETEEIEENNGNQISDEVKATQNVSLTKTTLCLHCRGPASTLCQDCGGAYFCDEPRKCSTNGWSHKCLCPIWKVYVDRRSELSSFPFLSGWQLPLLKEGCFTSEVAYEIFLINLGVLLKPTTNSSEVRESVQQKQTWWTTELHGWSGGEGQSAKGVNHFNRMSYQDGFALANTTMIPKERHITKDDIDHTNSTYNTNTINSNNNTPIQTDVHGLPILSSWEDYYRLRSLPPSSPVGLLATFPLTIYYAIQRYGIVPLTVAQMLDRSLRIHVVGIEKELNFVDLFKEVGYLIPKSIVIEMTWIVREDMFPENGNKKQLSLQLTSNLKLSIIGGTYGDSLNPTFDIDGGQPDMVIGMNAGLYAYESWRHVVSYLQHNKSIVGVFTDYNEHSGMNCASLGGWKSTNSLSINPFRQMRAMPVLCMNLPQFSNGFIYAFNEQELE